MSDAAIVRADWQPVRYCVETDTMAIEVPALAGCRRSHPGAGAWRGRLEMRCMTGRFQEIVIGAVCPDPRQADRH